MLQAARVRGEITGCGFQHRLGLRCLRCRPSKHIEHWTQATRRLVRHLGQGPFGTGEARPHAVAAAYQGDRLLQLVRQRLPMHQQRAVCGQRVFFVRLRVQGFKLREHVAQEVFIGAGRGRRCLSRRQFAARLGKVIPAFGQNGGLGG